MSTPNWLLGKSLTWPMEASTTKFFPKYFPIVLALAGDSTITKLCPILKLRYKILCFKCTSEISPPTSYLFILLSIYFEHNNSHLDKEWNCQVATQIITHIA